MIDLQPGHLGIVQAILREHVPDMEVRVFGSRVAGNAREASDLDIAIVGKEKMDWELISRIRDAFSDSDLPMRVDVLDWAAITETFRKVIEQGYEVIQKGRDGG